MTAESSWLDCDHCGSAAVMSETGLFYDGQGDECGACGFPGSVHCDSESDAEWICSDDKDARCNDRQCGECNPTAETFPEYEGQGS